MKAKLIEFDEECPSCGGTGLYDGMAERGGAAVVCHTCKGTGCHRFKHEYKPFIRRKKRAGVERVYEVNPGIIIGIGNGHALTDFGGMPYFEWEAGLKFPAGSENRNFTCPAWWYQSANYKLKPDWDECNAALGCSFSRCPCFKNKRACWARWDDVIGRSADA